MDIEKLSIELPVPKVRITVRLDHDVLEWLKEDGKGYQTRMNAILRAYMKADKQKEN